MKKPSEEQLLQDVLSDMPWKDIAEKYGYSDARFLRKLANRYGFPKRRIIRKPEKNVLTHLIQVEKLTPYQIAERLGYGSGGWSNIYAYCREYGIKFDFSINHDLRSVPFTSRQKSIVYGTLLGDGYLRPSSEHSYALALTHGQKQKAYLEWKLSELDNFVTKKNFYCTKHSFHGNAPTYHFSTITHPFLTETHDLCYPNRKKTVSIEWLSKLTALSLAVWYMDDGSINRRYRTIVLCTNCFSYTEHELIRSYFSDKWGIDTKIEKRRNEQFIIRINASQSNKFLDIISPHIPSCMIYKLG